MKLPPEKAIFIFINGTLPLTSAFIEQVYDKHKQVEEDGFLYLYLCGENTFG